MKKLLPLNKGSYITSRTSTAFQLGAVQILPNYSDAWLCSEFINLRYLPEDKIRCDFLHKDFWFTSAKMFIRQSLLFSKETLQFDSFDVIKYIISAINDGNYVTGDFNAYYIPDKIEYKIINRRDTYLIYGYDLLNECFYLMGDTIHGYGSHEVRFEDYINSISNRDDGMFNINIMEYNPEFSFDFSKDQLYKSINNYVESLDSDVFHNLVSPKFGLDAIRQLKADILVDYGRGQLIRDKSFLVLCEHKKLMVLRLKYLNDYTDIQVGDVICQAEENYWLSKDILQYCQMYINNNDLHAYPLIVESLQLLIDNDEKICITILSRL